MNIYIINYSFVSEIQIKFPIQTMFASNAHKKAQNPLLPKKRNQRYPEVFDEIPGPEF